ncbi:MAG: hypothetical protein IKD28_02140, partial [Clostridia bacterium]|nr:hypothetical protein [Clostridia bacterium]
MVQPHYSFDGGDIAQCYEGLMSLLDACDDSLDLIVLPEYSDALADVQGKDGFYGAVDVYNKALPEHAAETARRCGAMVFVNAGYITEDGVRNTTH